MQKIDDLETLSSLSVICHWASISSVSHKSQTALRSPEFFHLKLWPPFSTSAVSCMAPFFHEVLGTQTIPEYWNDSQISLPLGNGKGSYYYLDPGPRSSYPWKRLPLCIAGRKPSQQWSLRQKGGKQRWFHGYEEPPFNLSGCNGEILTWLYC